MTTPPPQYAPAPLPHCQRCGRPAHEHVGWRCPGSGSASDRAFWLLLGGLAAAVIGTVLHYVPFMSFSGQRVSISEIHAACSSPLGSLAQDFSARALSDCSGIGAAYDGSLVLVGAGVLLVVGAVVMFAVVGGTSR